MRTNQNFVVGRGEQFVVRFVVTGAAGATDAAWHLAETPDTPLVEHDLDLTPTNGGLTFQPAGSDLNVDLHFTSSLTEPLPVGDRYHELWVTLSGESRRWADGTVTVQDTLKS